MGSLKIKIEVAYATPERQEILSLQVPAGTTMREAIELSGILQHFPEINLAAQNIGVFSKKRELTDVVRAGDRIEIYRPLTIDPKEARRAKAKQKLKKAAGNKKR